MTRATVVTVRQGKGNKMVEIDLGSTGDSINVCLRWSVRGTEDGAVGARQFYLREGAAKDEYAEAQVSPTFLAMIQTLSRLWGASAAQAGTMYGLAA